MPEIKALIFDLGGVIINLDPSLTLASFHKLGLDKETVTESMPLFQDFEKGKISEAAFRDGLRELLNPGTTDAEIDAAWNHMLLDIPPERMELLRELRSTFRLYLLSNTNSIHKTAFVSYFETTFHGQVWPDQFDRIFYSHDMGMRKPDAEIFHKVLEETNHAAAECIFIDDSLPNVEAAQATGLYTVWAQKPLAASMVEEINTICKAVATA